MASTSLNKVSAALVWVEMAGVGAAVNAEVAEVGTGAGTEVAGVGAAVGAEVAEVGARAGTEVAGVGAAVGAEVAEVGTAAGAEVAGVGAGFFLQSHVNSKKNSEIIINLITSLQGTHFYNQP